MEIRPRLNDSKISDNDSGTDLNQASESDAEELLGHSRQQYDDCESETESGYRGRILSNSDDECVADTDHENNIKLSSLASHNAYDDSCADYRCDRVYSDPIDDESARAPLTKSIMT